MGGGKLAVIHSSEETKFIHSKVPILNNWYWLGDTWKENSNATDGGANSWEWSDHTPWDYTDWWVNEPNNINENCLFYVLPR